MWHANVSDKNSISFHDNLKDHTFKLHFSLEELLVIPVPTSEVQVHGR